MKWDAGTYEAFAELRQRPFLDLLTHVHHPEARLVVDAGCGTGRTTVRLRDRFPHAEVLGIDGSAEMLADVPAGQRLRFLRADLQDWRPEAPADVVVANAVLQWLPEPEQVLHRLADWVAPGGTLAIQVPANFDQPSHRLVREAAAPHVLDRLAAVAPGDHVLELEAYAALLEGQGFDVDAWQTTYRMRLPPGGILQWLKGTTLRPYIEAFGSQAEDWLAELGKHLSAAYPPDERGEVFPFTRRFVVAQRHAGPTSR